MTFPKSERSANSALLDELPRADPQCQAGRSSLGSTITSNDSCFVYGFVKSEGCEQSIN